jgi:hypothetical protein
MTTEAALLHKHTPAILSSRVPGANLRSGGEYEPGKKDERQNVFHVISLSGLA